jgi:hypothetical protein
MAEGPRLRRPPPRARPGPRQRPSRRCARGRQLSAEASARANIQARQTPSWPRSWANFSLFWLYSHRNTWANLHLLGQPDTFLAFIATPVSLTSLECQVSELVNRDACPRPTATHRPATVRLGLAARPPAHDTCNRILHCKFAQDQPYTLTP